MKTLPQELDDKLLGYLDNSLPSTEHRHIETMLTHDTNLKERLRELQQMHALMEATKPDQPSLNFTSRVMLGLNQSPATRSSIRNGIFLIIGVLITVGIAAALVSAGTFDGISATVDLNTIEITKKYIHEPLPSFSIDGKLLVQVIIILNLAIAFVVLDRAILKPLFHRRMHSAH